MSNIPVHPLKYILSGKGPAVYQHGSNKIYHRFIAAWMDIYLGLKSPLDQTSFVQSVLETFHYKGFRFVRFNTETKQYEDVDDDEAMKKIKQSFRPNKKPVAEAKPQMGHASGRPHKGDQQVEHHHQSNQSLAADGNLRNDVSDSHENSFSDGSVVDSNETGSGLSDRTLEPFRFPSSVPWSDLISQPPNYPSPRVFPAPLPCSCATEAGFSRQTDGSHDATQQPDKIMVAHFLRLHVTPVPVSTPDFANH